MIEYTVGISDKQNGTLQSSIIAVDASKKYNLSIEALGLKLGRKTKFYFGLNCLNENKVEIPSHLAWRISSAPIKVLDITSTSITASDAKGTNLWQTSDKAGHQRAIGFHFDGNINSAPDIVLYDADKGVYTGWEGTTLKLTPEAFKLHPWETIKSKLTSSTIMFNYHASGTYNYIAADAAPLSNEWKVFSGQIGGEGFNSHNLFRHGTKYVKILMLTNYYPENETGPLDEFIYRNIKFVENLTPSFITDNNNNK